MSTYFTIILLVIGLINIIFIKKTWVFISINALLIVNIIIEGIEIYNNSINNLISSPIIWLILYEIRFELISLIIIILGYILSNKN